MPIRMSGMISGMDTDALVKELMSAQSMKKTKIEQKKTKLEWKQEKWAELNTKIYKLYTDQLSKLRLAGNYAAKKASSSNENIITATASTSAGSGSHILEVSKLASAQYITGGKVNLKSNSKLVADAKMEPGTVIKITSGTGSNATVKTLEVTENTTIQDLVNTMKDAGLNANFDEAQGRFFISGTKSGAANAFSIQTYEMDETASQKLLEATNKLKEAGLTDSEISSYRTLLEDLNKKQEAYSSATDKVTAWTKLKEAEKKLADMEESLYSKAASVKVAKERLAALEALKNDPTSGTEEEKKAYKEVETAVKKAFYELDENGEPTEKFSEAALKTAENAYRAEAIANINKQMNETGLNFDTVEDREKAIEKEYQDLLTNNGGEEAALNKKAKESYEKSLDATLKNSANAYVETDEGKAKVEAEAERLKTADFSADLTEYGKAVKAYTTAISAAVNGTPEPGKLGNLGLTDIVAAINKDTGKFELKYTIPQNSDLNITEAADSEIKLDGAILTGEGNSFTVAGVTYSIKNVTAGEKVSITIGQDTDAVMGMVKDFVKSYNELMTEMNALYGADSAKGYEPLTDEEKEAMSDKQIEMWESKIKDSLLRRDDSLNSVITGMRSSLQTSVTVNGTQYSLASFGIVTGNYTERGLLHIYGDSEDSAYADQSNKLLEMFSKNPEEAAQALSGIAMNLYNTLQDKMKGNSVSSAMTFYNDKEMKKQITSYKEEISKWETRLEDMEERYYKQFSAMETALAKLQSQSSYLSNLMGG